MQQLAHQSHYFEEFTLDLTRGSLFRFQQEIKLRPKSFEVLKYLVTNSERLISKDELIGAVWIDTAVTDSSLVQCLKDIRHALHDEAQQIIKTVHGRGYIFDKQVSDIAPISPVTTYREETSGVQIIIEEEETNGFGPGPTYWLPGGSATAISAREVSALERFTAAVVRHKWLALTAISLTAMAAVIVGLARPAAPIDSVAVMPFVNVGGDPDTEYLSEGISDSIISRLSQLPNLKVVALNSVLRYRGKDADPQEIGRRLNVQAVLMSKLVQRGEDLSINTELIDVRDNRHLWGGRYNCKLADLNGVQAEIAQEISEKLRLSLTGEEKQRLTRRYTQSGEAYQLHMMGRYYRRRFSKEGFQKSIEYLEQALKKDANYAPAYAELGEVYRNLAWHGLLPAKDARQKEEWATLKALQIDDTLAEAHVLMANLKEGDLNWRGASEEYQRALELDRNSVRAHETYGWNLEMLGRMEEALVHLRRAQELDPLSLDISWDLGVLFTFSRQPDRAIRQFHQAIEMDPNFVPARRGLVSAYQTKGMHEEALAELEKANALQPREKAAQLGYAYAVAGKTVEARKILEELKVLATEHYVPPFDLALLYMGLGDKDQAFEWLNKTFDENPYRLSFINVNPRFDTLRSDARFKDLLRRMKLAA